VSALDFAQAPPLARPLRWLVTAPIWGLVAGLWLLVRGEAALSGRWSAETAALAHLFALGVLGNAMFGALLQFLPVAARCPLRLGRLADALHPAFNLGILTLVAGLCLPHPGALIAAPLLLTLPPVALAAAALPSLLASGALNAARRGIAFALIALLCTVVAGALAALVLRGNLAFALDRLVDVHAALGLLGWVLGLVTAVGSITMPMFQGARRVPERGLALWYALAALALTAGSAARLIADAQTALAAALAVPGVLWVLVSLASTAFRGTRDAALVHFWRAGSIALGIACVLAPLTAAQWLPERGALLAGALALAAGFPLLITGMLLEISAFLFWIALRRDCPRGVRVPGVGLLLPEADKRATLALHLAAALAIALALMPAGSGHEAITALAGVALALAHAATLVALLRLGRRARDFRRKLAPTARTDAPRMPP